MLTYVAASQPRFAPPAAIRMAPPLDGARERGPDPQRQPKCRSGATIATYQADQEVIGEGELAKNYYQVIDGLFRSVKFTRDGRRQVLAFYGPGDMFGLAPGATHEITVEAVKVGKLAIYGRGGVGAAGLSDARLAMALFKGAAEALARTTDHMTMIGRSSAVERFAWFLVDAAERFGEHRNGVIQCLLAMSRRDIADYLGLTIETISRVLANLKQAGIVALRTAREIEIRKPDLLRRLAAADRDDGVVASLLA
ncbi:helix-turn-helix domain-containing protein [Terrarubrum flagellatum]|uniref:helix-turn-helix domain-containing protein n=1 Tax=Terrirubrum flagellatum TaxID=2895980 RepID=UPI0031451C27